MNERRIIALLGRRDEPTDAVEEYCRYLGGALRDRGFAMELARVPWKERGWTVALRELQERTREWRGTMGARAIHGAGVVGARISLAVSTRRKETARRRSASRNRLPRCRTVWRRSSDRLDAPTRAVARHAPSD